MVDSLYDMFVNSTELNIYDGFKPYFRWLTPYTAAVALLISKVEYPEVLNLILDG